jgi:hypothetical protein
MSTLSQRSYGAGNARERERLWEAETSNQKQKNYASPVPGVRGVGWRVLRSRESARKAKGGGKMAS